MSEFRLNELTIGQIIIIALAFILVGVVLAYLLWAVFIILIFIGGFIVLHELLHFIRGD